MDAVVASVALETRLRDYMLSLAFEVGNELLAIVGASGSGKSIILRSIAGVYRPDAGKVEIMQQVMFQPALAINVPPSQRGIGYVPQNFALFPHLTVADNIAFPIRRGAHALVTETDRRVEELLDLLDLTRHRDRFPGDLMPEERVRVALARALVIDPDLLLLDDPFAGLDIGPRRQARAEFAELRRLAGVSTILATGDLDEACEIADRVAIVDRGTLLQLDVPATVLIRPENRRVAHLIGAHNVLLGTVVELSALGVLVDTSVGVLHVAGPTARVDEDDDVDLVIRPDQIRILPESEQPHADDNVLHGSIVDEVVHGADHALVFQPDGAAEGASLQIVVSDLAYQQLHLAPGTQRSIVLPMHALHVMPAE
jgi:ABC-type Fe3+/spermidine/putrescine transport system ATPase subunit